MDYDFLVNEKPLRDNFVRYVFPIGDNLVVKTNSSLDVEDEGWREILNGAKIQEELYNNGLFVPKPEGIIRVSFEESLRKKFNLEKIQKGFLMERIRGQSLDNLWNSSDYSKYSDKYYFEIKLASFWGFDPRDIFDNNAIVETSTGDVYMIDFDWWGKKNEI